jgi:three-Cys-motif partner protein
MPRQDTYVHQFGGRWTAQKLEVVGKYLKAYTVALKDKPTRRRPFVKAYIDGFAGTGSRRDSSENGCGVSQAELFTTADLKARNALLDGSARVALQTEPAFDRYIFIERNVKRCRELEALRTEFQPLAERIEVRQGDANSEIRAICSSDWASRRAVLFLDPYGMQVEWSTIEAVSRTKAIDLWLLFPLGIAVNRMVTHSGDIPPPWRARLNMLLGDERWYDEFYRITPVQNLFGETYEETNRVTMEVIGKRFVDRLRDIFPGVVDSPGVLRNSSGMPLYLLCFAAANDAGAKVAIKIASALLRGLR